MDAVSFTYTYQHRNLANYIILIDSNCLSGMQTKYTHQTFNKKQICIKLSFDCKLSLCIPECSPYEKSYSTPQLLLKLENCDMFLASHCLDCEVWAWSCQTLLLGEVFITIVASLTWMLYSERHKLFLPLIWFFLPAPRITCGNLSISTSFILSFQRKFLLLYLFLFVLCPKYKQY